VRPHSRFIGSYSARVQTECAQHQFVACAIEIVFKMGFSNCRSEQVLQGAQEKLTAAREEVHTQKRHFTAQLKDEVRWQAALALWLPNLQRGSHSNHQRPLCIQMKLLDHVTGHAQCALCCRGQCAGRPRLWRSGCRRQWTGTS
jgi:hypothetical protein